MPLDLKALVTARLGENYKLHEQHLNSTLVRVQRIIGFDHVYARAQGAPISTISTSATTSTSSAATPFSTSVATTPP